MNNADMPAMPIGEQIDGVNMKPICNGLTKREQFCLQMGAPETGDPELDDIIQKGERKRIAAIAMQGFISYGSADTLYGAKLARLSVHYADALLKELEK